MERIDEEANEISFCELFRFADTTDKILMIIGSVCSVIMGAALPLFYFITGDMINTFNEGDDVQSLAL